MLTANALSSLPARLFIASLLLYCFGRVLLNSAAAWIGFKRNPETVDAEKAVVQLDPSSDHEDFDLEKRAFLSKTWLYICHRSRFQNAGDYISTEIAGISFFVVLGKDSKLRAFHNVCRHRAYTVVRKPCGNSMRFTCKYHGWSYGDDGKLVKAPKFEAIADFVAAENGLFEIKLSTTREGLVFVNFHSSQQIIPFSGVRAGVPTDSLQWVAVSDFGLDVNWKIAAYHLAEQVRWAQAEFGWTKWWQTRHSVRMLGPLTMLKQVENGVWYTQSVLPVGHNETKISCNIFGAAEKPLSASVAKKWMSGIEKEWKNLERGEGRQVRPFAYECGGRMIELSAILDQQLRVEGFAGRRMNSVLQVTGTDQVDVEAEALGYELDRKANMVGCQLSGQCNVNIEW